MTTGFEERAADKPRVTHVVNSLDVGGLERLVHDLVLVRGADHTSVVCLSRLGPLGERMQARGVDVTAAGLGGGAGRRLLNLCRHFRRLRPDVVHCHNMTPHLYGGLAARIYGCPALVLTKHGAWPVSYGRAGPLVGWLMRRTAVVGVSPEVRDMMAPLRPGRLTFIPNGINLSDFDGLPSRREARERLGWDRDATWLGVVARLAPGKSHLTLLEAFREVRARVPGARLAIAGDGPRRAEIEAAAVAHKLSDSVTMLGERHDVPMILAALDAFVLPSEMEGMPITLLEAMAARRPVIASDVGGVPEIVEHGRSGLLVPASDAPALAGALLALLTDPEAAERLAREGRRRAEERFDVRTMIDAYDELYQSLLNGSG